MPSFKPHNRPLISANPVGGRFLLHVAHFDTLQEQNSLDVRLAAGVFTEGSCPDVYAWLQQECDLRAWLGIPLPEADDPRIAQFAERNTAATGEIETTHHVAWVAGVKR